MYGLVCIADVRVVESRDLKVEQSSLTGESDLVPISVDRRSDQVSE
jgi:magnesium-transporting ATPase (P-type)